MSADIRKYILNKRNINNNQLPIVNYHNITQTWINVEKARNSAEKFVRKINKIKGD